MIGLVLAIPRPPRRRWWQPKPRLTLRQLGKVTQQLQRAESMHLHGQRDQCINCIVHSTVVRQALTPTLPVLLTSDPDWMHRHIIMPGARHHARLQDDVDGQVER